MAGGRKRQINTRNGGHVTQVQMRRIQPNPQGSREERRAAQQHDRREARRKDDGQQA